MGRRALVEAQPFFRLPEVAADDVRELVQLHPHVGVEGVEVVDGEQPRRHVPLVPARVLVGPLDVGLGLEVRAEQTDVRVRVAVAHRLVGVEPQHLVVADREAHLGVHVGLHELSGPVAMVGADEAAGGDVVQEAGEDDLLARPVLLREPRALQQVGGGPEAVAEEIEQGGLVGHARQARVVPHEVALALIRRVRQRRARIALARGVDDGLHDDESVQLLELRVVGGLGLL